MNSGENNNYYILSNAYSQSDMTAKNDDIANFADPGIIRLAGNAFTYTFERATLATTRGSKTELNKCLTSASENCEL